MDAFYIFGLGPRGTAKQTNRNGTCELNSIRQIVVCLSNKQIANRTKIKISFHLAPNSRDNKHHNYLREEIDVKMNEIKERKKKRPKKRNRKRRR